MLDQLKQLGPERTDLMSLRGYAYLWLKRYAVARRVFEALAAIGNRDGQRGLGILYEIFNDKDKSGRKAPPGFPVLALGAEWTT